MRTAPRAFFSIKSEELPEYIAREAARQRDYSPPPTNLPLAVVDDLHNVVDRDSWAAKLEDTCRFDLPRVAILACGPSPEREAITRLLGSMLDIREFAVPHLNETESAEFRGWAEKRTGLRITVAVSSEKNKPLVQWLFELSHNETLGAFVKSFENRLRQMGLSDIVRLILAVNALDLPAATALLGNDEERDNLALLCRKDQLHFEIHQGAMVPHAGYRLAHPGLVWPMYLEWPRNIGTAVAPQWARDLSISMEQALGARDELRAAALLFRLGSTDLLEREQLCATMTELYRKHVENWQERRKPFSITSSALTQTEGTGRRLTLARMTSAGLVQTKGLGSALCSSR
jgi:hypothetical protein